MKSKKQIRQKLQQFYEDVKGKKKVKKWSYKSTKNFNRSKKKRSEWFEHCTNVFNSLRGGKAFAAEQNKRELKTRIGQLNSQKLKISPKKIVEISTANMNIEPVKKYGFSPGRKKVSKKWKIQNTWHRTQTRKNAQVKSKNGEVR